MATTKQTPAMDEELKKLKNTKKISKNTTKPSVKSLQENQKSHLRSMAIT